MSDAQIHGKFKVFVGPVGSDGLIDEIAKRVEAFCAKGDIAPKSVGVEYLESQDVVVLSLGYRDDEPGYAIKLVSPVLGVFENLDPVEIEKAMRAVCLGVENVICHEFYVREDGQFVMVLLAKQ